MARIYNHSECSVPWSKEINYDRQWIRNNNLVILNALHVKPHYSRVYITHGASTNVIVFKSTFSEVLEGTLGTEFS